MYVCSIYSLSLNPYAMHTEEELESKRDIKVFIFYTKHTLIERRQNMHKEITI